MSFLKGILPYAHIGLAIILIVSILLQSSGAGVGGAFGGSEGVIRTTKRGFEKFLFYVSIVTGVLFAAASLLALFVK